MNKTPNLVAKLVSLVSLTVLFPLVLPAASLRRSWLAAVINAARGDLRTLVGG